MFFFVTAVMLMMTIDNSLNRLFRVQRARPLLQQVLMYWAVITLGPVLIGGSLSMTSFAVGASFGWLRLSIVADAVLGVLPFLFTCAALTLLYQIVPNRHVPARDALIGGVLAGIAFEIAKRGFAIYLTRFPTYTLIYGAFATIPIFLVWLYMSWVVVLAGATLTAMLPAYRYAEAKPIAGARFRRRAAGAVGARARAGRRRPGAPAADQQAAAPDAAPLRGGAGARRAPGLDRAHRQGRLGAGARLRSAAGVARSTGHSPSTRKPGKSGRRDLAVNLREYSAKEKT